MLIVGVRGENGTLQLLHEPVTDDGLVRKAVAMLLPRGTKPGGSPQWSLIMREIGGRTLRES